MKANPGKFQAMFLGDGIDSESCQISVGDITLTGEKSITILGLDIDCKLTFTDHINKLCAKTSAQINAIMRIKSGLDRESKLALYNSFIISNFQYCNVVWMFTGRTNLNRLDRLNERAIRMIYNDKVTDYHVLLMQNNQLSVYKLCFKSLLCMMFKVWNNTAPQFLLDLFVKKQSLYNLRDHSIFMLPMYNYKKIGYHCFHYIGCKSWNDLKINLKLLNNISLFKKYLKCHLIECDNNVIVQNYF